MSALNLGALKRSSSKDMLNKLKQDVQAATSKTSYADDRFWEPTKDSSGSGYAVLRFLPARAESDLPFAKTYSHGFKNMGNWFIENCPTTIGKDCPVCSANNELWNSGIESNKKIASERKRNLKYIANVYIVKDPAHPENDGQIKLFRFGQKIMDKIQTSLNGRPELGIEPKNVFGFFDSVNFNLVMVKVANFPNYDQSTFVDAGDLHGGDETKLMEVLNKMYDLNEFTAEKQFKSPEELKTRLDKVLGLTGVVGQASVAHAASESFEQVTSSQSKGATELHSHVESTTVEPTQSGGPVDDDLAFFQSLASK
jgi:hypothetical protein